MTLFKKKSYWITGCVIWCVTASLTGTVSANPTDNLPPLPTQETTEILSADDSAALSDPLEQAEDETLLSDAGGSRAWWSTSDNANGARLRSQTQLLLGVGVVAVGVLYAMPESVTNWDRDQQVQDLPNRWWKNVSRRPVWDKDDWFINYVGHTYCGGVYYQMARKSGYNQWDSFLYTTVMSTFFWEYGIEAFAERPSVQDLIVTPLGGWLYGEFAYRYEQRIEENDKRVLGSRTLGHLSLFLLDPIDHMGQGVNWLFGSEWVLTGRVTFQSQTYAEENEYAVAQNNAVTPGFRMALKRPF